MSAAPGEPSAAGPRFSDPFGERRIRQLVADNTRLERALRELDLSVDAQALVAMVDRNDTILEANEKFVAQTKYPRGELIGESIGILNSGRHTSAEIDAIRRRVALGEVWQGTLCSRAKDGTEFWAATTILPLVSDHQRVEKCLYISTDVTPLHLAEQRVRTLAYADTLTGLPNRARMLTHLTAQARGEGGGLRAYVTAEFEGIGLVNDTYGFAVADHLLMRIAERFDELGYTEGAPILESPLERRPEFVARIGTAAFAADFGGFGDDREIARPGMQRLAEQFGTIMLTTMRAELGSAIEPRVRVSYVEYRPGDLLDGADVFTRAEAARRHGPAPSPGGPVRAVEFDQGSMDEAAKRADLVLDLRSGVASDRLRLFLQPVVGADRRIRGYEGLLRWLDPVRGVVQPAEFIHLAERTAMIVEIGEWVLDEACRILAVWAQRPETSGYTISVNVSERQLRPDALVQSLRRSLAAHGASADKLKLEVTESMLQIDPARSIEVLDALRVEGVQISLDDFGTGYSSLNRLTSLPVQQLKIDRSFVEALANGPRDAAIVGVIVNFARTLGMNVVAEGIETEEQFEQLRGFDIDLYQGYLFGKPEMLDIR